MKIDKYSIIKAPYNIKKVKLGSSKKFGIKITKKLFKSFAKFTGDKSPIHGNIKFCIKNGFSGLLGYVFFIECILSQIYGMYFPGGSELCIQHTSKYIKPYYVNDYLYINITAIQKNVSAKLLTLNVNIFVKKKNYGFILHRGKIKNR